MKYHWINVSGGKDSTALLLWSLENEIPNCRYVFADTQWEHPLTYAYLGYLEDKTGVQIERVETEGFGALAIRKKIIPSRFRRFCTQELKTIPLARHMDSEEGEDATHLVYVGVRRQESATRAKLTDTVAREVKYPPRKTSRQLIHHPLLDWTHDDVFEISKRHGIDPNPLYFNGAKRVGCFPCVMANFGEIKRLADKFPEMADRVEKLESAVNEASGKSEASLVAQDKLPAGVPIGFRNFLAYMDQGPEIPGLLDDDGDGGCLSVYGLCE